jgi:ABC-type Fe3+ transport system permease subunit
VESQRLDLVLVLAAGPAGLKAFADDPVILRFLQNCYANAVNHTLYVALATSAVAVPFALCMQWLNVKNISKVDSLQILPEGDRGDAPAE